MSNIQTLDTLREQAAITAATIRLTKQAEKEAEKVRKLQEREAERERKEQEREAERERKEQEREAEKERKERELKEEKQRKEAQKQLEKERKERELKEERERKEAQKQLEKEELRKEKERRELERKQEREAERERKLQEKEEDRAHKREERETERRRREEAKETEKRETFQSKLVAEYGKMQLMLNRASNDIDLSTYDGFTIERVERYHGPSIAYVYYHWEELIEKRGKAYDHKSRQYLADQVYKAQYFKMIKELDTEEWPVVKRTVKYTQPSYKYGRYVVRDVLGLQGISRPFRHTFSAGIYRDVDIKNAHPTIYKWLCDKLKLDTKYLTMYINNRDFWLDTLVKANPGTKRDFWKMTLLARLNGGKKGRELPDSKVEIDGIIYTEFEETFQYTKEIERNHEEIVQYFDETLHLQKYRKSVQEAEKSHNINGSIVNHWLNDMENKILCTMIMYLKTKGLQMDVLSFDGGMIHVQDKSKLALCNDDLLQELSQVIFEQFTINLNFSYKDFDEGIEIPESELNVYNENDPMWRNFKWRELDEKGGSDYNCALLLKKVFQEDIILTDVSRETKGLSFDIESKLWESTTCFSIQNRISEELQEAVNKGIDYWSTKLRNSKDENEYKILEAKANEWIQRKKDRSNWGNVSKASSVFTSLKPMLRKEDFGNKMNVSVPHEMPILEGKVIDLKTGLCRERVQTDYYDFECPVKYTQWKDIEASKRAIVKKFMKELFENDMQVVKYMQILTGYLMTHENSARSVYMVPGDGSNGKSFYFNDILGGILGKNYQLPDPRNMIGDNESNFVGAFQLMSKACTTCLSELPTNSSLNENLFKRVTGNDGFSKERKGKEELVSIKFLCKLVVLFNWYNIPEVSLDDKAFWDRVVCLYFPACFKSLSDSEKLERTNLYKKHIDVFFSYFVEGAKKYYANPSELNNKPAKIVENTQRFKSTRDSIERFIKEVCIVPTMPSEDKKEDSKRVDYTNEEGQKLIEDSPLWVNKERLFNRYKIWGTKNSVFTAKQPALGKYMFYSAIEAKGYKEKREGTDSIRVFQGIDLPAYFDEKESDTKIDIRHPSLRMNHDTLEAGREEWNDPEYEDEGLRAQREA